MDLSARSAEGLAATSFTDAGNMSANSELGHSRDRLVPHPSSADGLVLGNLPIAIGKNSANN